MHYSQIRDQLAVITGLSRQILGLAHWPPFYARRPRLCIVPLR